MPHQGISRRARLQLRSSRLRLPSVNHAATQRSSGAVCAFQRCTGAGDPAETGNGTTVAPRFGCGCGELAPSPSSSRAVVSRFPCFAPAWMNVVA